MAQQRPPQIPINDVVQRLLEENKLLSAAVRRSEQRISALEAVNILAAQGRKPRMPVEFRAQFNEDVWLWELFNRRTDGFFIEVGAFDGYNYSLSYVFECVGWTGLLVEAIPSKYQLCAQRRTASRVVHAALGRRNAPSTAQFTLVDDPYGGMLSFNATTREHLSKIGPRFRTEKVTVPQTTMNALLADHTGDIDFASIDVEGGELDLLDGFDLLKHRPKVLLIEDNERGADPAIGQFMAAMPYTFCDWLGHNRVYIRSDLTDLQERLRWLTIAASQ